MDKKWAWFAVIAALWIGCFFWVGSPIDPIPDVIPIIGWLDDLFVLIVTAGLTAAIAALGIATEIGVRAAKPIAAQPVSYEPLPVELIRAL